MITKEMAGRLPKPAAEVVYITAALTKYDMATNITTQSGQTLDFKMRS